MSIAIVQMVKQDDGKQQSICINETSDSGGGEDDGDVKQGLSWSGAQVSWVLSSFFIGYVVFQVPGGRLAEFAGSKRVFGWTMGGVALLAAATPLIAQHVGVWMVIAVRLVQGGLEAASFPALNPLVSKWVPTSEKPVFLSFAYVGGTFGTIVTYPMCGLIIEHLGWEAVFYITAGITVLWVIVWQVLVSELPEESRFISVEEREYIIAHRTFDSEVTQENVPMVQLLKDMLLRPPMLALMLCDFANSWGLYTLVTEGPIFFWEVLGFDIGEVGWKSSMPYLGRFLGAQLFGAISAQVLKRRLLSPINSQKLNVCIEFLFPAAGMLWLSYVTDNPDLCVAILSISFFFNGAIYSGHTMTGLAMAPNRSGTVMGLSNGFGSIAGIIVPPVKEALVGSPSTCADLINRWRIMFAIPAGVYSVTAIIFIVFGRAEVEDFDRKEYRARTRLSWLF